MSPPGTMRAALLVGHGGPEMLQVRDDVPVPGPDDALINTIYLNDLELFGATIYGPGLFADLVGYIERGEIRPVLGGTFPLERIREAQEAFVRKEHFGNLVITLS